MNVVPNNLPLQLSSFIGREREIAEVRRRLDTSRLVTLTGPGGAGKTRLAIQVAGMMADRFADGVWFIPLVSLAVPALLPQAVASAVGLLEQPDRPLMDSLTQHLRTRQLLLVLDNCEHLIESCAQLATNLLQACPDVRILATSREPLNIDGEFVDRAVFVGSTICAHRDRIAQIRRGPAVRGTCVCHRVHVPNDER